MEQRSDRALFGITANLAAGLADDTALLINVLAGNDLTEHIQKVLDDVTVAESWESMAMRSIGPGHRATAKRMTAARRPRTSPL